MRGHVDKAIQQGGNGREPMSEPVNAVLSYLGAVATGDIFMRDDQAGLRVRKGGMRMMHP